MATPLSKTLDTLNLLGTLPQALRDELLEAYNLIIKNYREGRWAPSELDGGKLCEVVYTILRGYIDGTFPSKSSKPRDLFHACLLLEHEPNTIPRSIRIQLPRMLIALYEIRNNRGVVHVGGEVNANRMDATCILYMSKWIIAELIRLFHSVDTENAEAAIEVIVERIIPVVWKIGDKYRILDTTATMKEKTLLFLHQNTTPLSELALFDWVEHSNATNYRRDVLRPLHRLKLIEYDEDKKLVHISPKGILFVDKNIIPKMNTIV